jgi:anaerobic ribonucleoside-triphosphate reductase activating protein
LKPAEVRLNHLRLHRFIPASRANGPGLRSVIWVQGCALGCPGCFNPETHAFDRGELLSVATMTQRVLAVTEPVEGLTLSGGEPFHQHRALANLLAAVRAVKDLSVVLFSGYTWEEIHKIPRAEDLLAHVDVLIAGRYDAARRQASALIGSDNKTVHFLSERYTPADLARVPAAEVILSPDGEVIFSGIDPLQW